MEKANLNILIIEENPVLTKKYLQALSSLELNILTVENCKSAFELFPKQNPKLILSSIRICQSGDFEFVKQIQQIEPSVRFILTADPSDSRLIIDALELDIKSVLLKPVKKDKLVKVVKEQLASKNLQLRLELEEKRRRFAEKENDKSSLILHSVSQATTYFFRSGFNEKTANEALALIGQATKASRVYIYQSFKQKEKNYTLRIYEWVAEGIKASKDIPEIRKVSLSGEGFEGWGDSLREKGYFSGVVSDFTEHGQAMMKMQDIRSLLVFPITVNNEWWGFVGLDDCRSERIWIDSELSALKSLAFNLGAAIYRKQLDDELIKLNQNLEQRVKERTSELEIEVFERSIAEALLKDSEEKYRLIYEHASYGILLMQGGKITMTNPAMIEIFEDIPRNLIGRELSELVPKRFKSIVSEKLNKETEEASKETFEIQVITANRKSKWLELKPKLISWYGEPAYLVFASNISLRKKAEQELQQLNSSLENRIDNEIRRVEHQRQLLVQKSKLESMGELSAGLAHEINQPLVSISMGLDNMLMMISDQKLNEDYISKKIHTLFKDIDRIRNIIEHVRIFSRDQQVGNESEISVNDVIRNALSMIRIQFTDHNVHLNIDIDAEEVTTFGNQYKLEQVILNLLSNSKYAVEEKAKRNIGNGYEKEISVSCRKDNNLAILEVSDNGTGIEKNILANIFNPFFTTKDEEKGTGLGLSISYAIINEMKGSIKVNSIVNEFTKITIELPLKTLKENEHEEP
ncbi:MAG TPA: ATP-binding protein [Bacteroidales bacterium]